MGDLAGSVNKLPGTAVKPCQEARDGEHIKSPHRIWENHWLPEGDGDTYPLGNPPPVTVYNDSTLARKTFGGKTFY